MEQVPTYTIIGDGRVARHISHYFSLLGIPHTQWNRKNDPGRKKLEEKIAKSSCVLLLISDSAIDNFIHEHSFLKDKVLVHFSGALCIDLAYGFHPMATFRPELYELEMYGKIPFIGEVNGPRFGDIFPNLPNSSFSIPKEKKAHYHAMCVLANNCTTLLWEKFFSEMEGEYEIPQEELRPFLTQTLQSIGKNPKTALTGPIARRDFTIIEKNLNALKGDAFQKIYQAFVDTQFQPQTV